MNSFHSAECEALEVNVRESTIQHKNEGREIFADQSIGKEEVVRCYYGSLVYEELIGCSLK